MVAFVLKKFEKTYKFMFHLTFDGHLYNGVKTQNVTKKWWKFTFYPK